MLLRFSPGRQKEEDHEEGEKGEKKRKYRKGKDDERYSGREREREVDCVSQQMTKISRAFDCGPRT